MSKIYPYASGELLVMPQSYMYTRYHGDEFIPAWRDSRAQVLATISHAEPLQCSLIDGFTDDMGIDTSLLLAKLVGSLRSQAFTDSLVVYWLPRLVKKFEVSKRLYAHYMMVAPHRPLLTADYLSLEPYLRLAECLQLIYCHSPDSRYLNCLLKLNDSLISQHGRMTAAEVAALAWGLDAEMKMIDTLSAQIGLVGQGA